MRNPECNSYGDMAERLAEEFRAGENVHAGDIAYLRDFSDSSRLAYDWLMDRVATLYADALDDASGYPSYE